LLTARGLRIEGFIPSGPGSGNTSFLTSPPQAVSKTEASRINRAFDLSLVIPNNPFSDLKLN
jgi:hypothetical protein